MRWAVRVSSACASAITFPPKWTNSKRCGAIAATPRRAIDMCGLAGAIGQIDPPVRDAVIRMPQRLAHRGPDDQGLWSSVDQAANSGIGAVLAFRRLAIIDLSPAGHQPMRDPATGNVLVFNGEIYNHAELRDRLVRQGQSFDS